MPFLLTLLLFVHHTLAAPAGMLTELRLWQSAVETADPATIAAALKPGASLTVRRIHYPDGDGTTTLTAETLRQRLSDGEANALGLDKHLLSPREADIEALPDGRYSATDKRCPEVTWIFARQDRQWRLVEIERRLYGC